MSDLLNKASLVMVPSGYKEDTVYSVVPTDGSGDLSFTRASNGTRINSAGLVEVTPWNLAQYSEEFNNAIYTVKSAVTIVDNSTTAPNGTTTAELIYPNSSGNYRYVAQIFSQSANIYTSSIYAKAQNKSVIWMYMDDSSTNGIIYFDLSDGTMSVTAGGYATPVGTMTAVGNGWYRCTFTYGLPNTLSSGSGFGVCDAKGSPYATASGTNGVYFWGYQVNIGSTAKPYFPTTDRLNVPRLTYQNGGGGCPSLLLEKQSTNLQKYSEQFDQTSAWGIGSGAISANQTISPDGTQNADLFNSTSIVGGQINNNPSPIGITSGVAYTFSLFIKNNTFATGEYIQFNTTDNITSELIARINPFDKTITNLSGTGSPAWSSLSSSVVDFGNGWSRYIITATAANNSGAAVTYLTSNNAKNCYIWGFQSEASSYATSYIPTTSSSATRVADLSTSDTIQTAQTFAGDFTFFVDFVSFTTTDNVGPTNQMIMGGGFLSGGSSYKSYLWITGNVIILTGDGEVNMGSVSKTFNANQRYKLLVKRNGTTIKFFCDGVQVGSSSTSSLSITIRSIGWSYASQYRFNGLINQVVLSATGFSDADCQALTTI